MKLGQVAASSSETFPLEHVPQMLGILFDATGVITNITVTTDVDGVIMNLSGDAFKELARSFSFTEVDPTTDILFVPLADGEIRGRRCSITVTTAAGASGVGVYDTSLVESFTKQVYVSLMMNVLTNGNADLSKFTKCVILSMGATDLLTYRSNVGNTQMQLTKTELQGLGYATFNNSTDAVVLDNKNMSVGCITFSPVAERTVVYHRMAVGGSVELPQMLSLAKQNVEQSGAKTSVKKQVINRIDSVRGAVITAKK